MRTSRVFPNDVNNHNTLFGGRLMSDIDQVASISAAKHSRRDCVTASTDSVDFLHSPNRFGLFRILCNLDGKVFYGGFC